MKTAIRTQGHRAFSIMFGSGWVVRSATSFPSPIDTVTAQVGDNPGPT